jgi:protease I
LDQYGLDLAGILTGCQNTAQKPSGKGGFDMARIAVLMDDLFEDVEYTRPADAFREKGHQLVHVGLKKGKEITGKKGGARVKIDQAVTEVSPDDFDALFIPGGYSPDQLRAHEEAVTFAGRFVESGRPVFSICHAPQLLITARVIKNRTITGWRSIIQDIRNAGAEFVDRDVVVDGNLVSSREPGDIPAFVKAALEKLH